MKMFSQLSITAAVVVALGGLGLFDVADDTAVAPANETQLAVAPQATVVAQAATSAVPPDDGKLRIICFGAHPDDAEYKNGGTAAKWAKLGHHVKFVSVTNGDIGHWNMAGGALAQRRTAEVDRKSVG